MAWTEKCRGCMYENACDYITCRIEHEKEIRNKAIDEFAERLIKHFADWQLSEDDIQIKYIITQACEGVEEIAEQMKGV